MFTEMMSALALLSSPLLFSPLLFSPLLSSTMRMVLATLLAYAKEVSDLAFDEDGFKVRGLPKNYQNVFESTRSTT